MMWQHQIRLFQAIRQTKKTKQKKYNTLGLCDIEKLDISDKYCNDDMTCET